MPLADAVTELRDNAGSQFDPDVVEALVRVVERYGPPPVPASPEGRAELTLGRLARVWRAHARSG
jgi:HD-GYP domain-containing protein (c-di-GMP phosphodiesterase class II)